MTIFRSLKVAVQMDGLSTIKPETDSTLCLIKEALSLGFEIWYYTPDKLYLDCGNVLAVANKISKNAEALTLSEPERIDLASFDVILMRNDPPMNMDYLTSTYILEKIQSHTLIVNNPTEVRNCPEKLLICNYPELMPPTIVTRDSEIAIEFFNKYQDIIIKPLYEFAGKDISRIQNRENLHTLFNNLLAQHATPLMLQKFLPAVSYGDKRVFLIDGEVAGVINRVPQKGDIKANLAIGGRAERCTLNEREQKICQILGSDLRTRGIIFAGLDIIDNYVTEANITSPTGIIAINKVYNLTGNDRLEYRIWEKILLIINN